MDEETKSLIELLRETREGYDSERERHALYLDAYAGTGGFQGRARMEASGFWGQAAEVYSPSFLYRGITESLLERTSYLDRHQREDDAQYRRRVAMAHYENHVATVVDVPLAFLANEGIQRQIESEALSAWLDDVDGAGLSWSQFMRDVVWPRAWVLGWCPVLLDLPEAPRDEAGNTVTLNVAQARELGMTLRVIPLFPANLLEWEVDDRGNFTWAKVYTCTTERAEWNGKRKVVERWTIWTAKHAEVYELERDEGDDAGKTARWRVSGELRPHPFGQVPIEVLRYKPQTNERVRGVSAIHNLADTARRAFNQTSELDEHIRKTVFAMLQVPTRAIDQVKTMVAGNANALPIDPESRQPYAWISPSTDVSEIIEKRIEVTVADVYRIGKVEFTKAKGAQAQSGISRAFEFETANRAIAEFATRDAGFEQKILTLAAKGIPGADGAVIRITPPKSFAIEELSREAEDTQAILDVGVGATAGGELRKRLVRRALPLLDEKTLTKIDAEIEGEAADEQRAREQARAAGMVDDASTGGGRQPARSPVDDDEEDDDDGED